jgi:hypothetical protein
LHLYSCGQDEKPTWNPGEEHFTPAMIAISDSSVDFAQRHEAHRLQSLFALQDFIVMSPGMPADGTFFSSNPQNDPSEAMSLLSTLAIALGNCNSAIPAFVPVHEASRFAYVGVCAVGDGGTSVHFETDFTTDFRPKRHTIQTFVELFKAKLSFRSALTARAADPGGGGVLLSACFRWRCTPRAAGRGGQPLPGQGRYGHTCLRGEGMFDCGMDAGSAAYQVGRVGSARRERGRERGRERDRERQRERERERGGERLKRPTPFTH